MSFKSKRQAAKLAIVAPKVFEKWSKTTPDMGALPDKATERVKMSKRAKAVKLVKVIK